MLLAIILAIGLVYLVSVLQKRILQKLDYFKLTNREKEVYELLATTDLSFDEIAKKLVISPATLTTHKTNIYGKLLVSNRAELTRFYYKEILKNHGL